MRSTIRLASALAALCLALPAAAEPAAADQKPVNIADQNRQICKKTETTGTRLGVRRECKTKAEWDAIAQLGKEELERILDVRTRVDQ